MRNINVYLKDNLKTVSKNIFISPDIPEKKLNNSIKAFNILDDYKYVIAIYDNTVFGSAKDGIVFTGEKLIYKPVFSDPITVFYKKISSAEHVCNISYNGKGKEKKEEFMQITLDNDEVIKISGLLSCNYKELASIINSLSENFDEYSNEDQMISLDQMSAEVRLNYLKVIVNMAFYNNDKVDAKEFAEIFLLMARLNFTKEMRSVIREYLRNINEMVSVEILIANIDNACIASHNKAIKISLVKDLLNIHHSLNSKNAKPCDFLDKYQKLFDVTEDEKELALEAIKQDYKILNENISDSIIAKNVKELSAKAGAIGVPIAAVYLSGSVIGMSAAGMTSGLASLGLGGILGFSSMATGIGVVVLLGVLSYKGVKYLTGANEIDKYKTRELMLNEVLKQTQSTLSILMEDINLITDKLNSTMSKYFLLKDKSGLTIETLLKREEELQQIINKELKLYSDSGIELNNRKNKIVTNKAKVYCPSVLDLNKLKHITSDPSKKDAYDQIISYYHEENISETKDSKTIDKVTLKLNDDISSKDMELLAEIFNALGYFNTVSTIASSVKGIFK